MPTATLSKKSNININDIDDGDIFSEQSHYIAKGEPTMGKSIEFIHLESGNVVSLAPKYVEELLQTADQFDGQVVEVGIEDKKWTAKQIEAEVNFGDPLPRVGDVKQKGILSIWNDIHSAQVFTVNFNKANKEMSNKALTEAKVAQAEAALKKINDAAKDKRGVATTAALVIAELQNNPILPIEKGEERTLRGYKTQFESINGVYDVVDMDITTGVNKRQVNVRAINWLVFNGVRYNVK